MYKCDVQVVCKLQMWQRGGREDVGRHDPGVKPILSSVKKQTTCAGQVQQSACSSRQMRERYVRVSIQPSSNIANRGDDVDDRDERGDVNDGEATGGTSATSRPTTSCTWGRRLHKHAAPT